MLNYSVMCDGCATMNCIKRNCEFNRHKLGYYTDGLGIYSERLSKTVSLKVKVRLEYVTL